MRDAACRITIDPSPFSLFGVDVSPLPHFFSSSYGFDVSDTTLHPRASTSSMATRESQPTTPGTPSLSLCCTGAQAPGSMPSRTSLRREWCRTKPGPPCRHDLPVFLVHLALHCPAWVSHARARHAWGSRWHGPWQPRANVPTNPDLRRTFPLNCSFSPFGDRYDDGYGYAQPRFTLAPTATINLINKQTSAPCSFDACSFDACSSLAHFPTL